jgi:NAD(P)-dependent dehydrogenase (short-subunit alcohol dehydrogenase family)
MPMRLRDKVIVVTGSTTGVGEGIARRCVAEGAKVIIHGLERHLGERVTRELGSATALLCNDLSRAESAGELIRFAVTTFGRIDGLVNNAASVARANIETTTVESFDRIIALNLRAPLLLIQAALPYLKQSHGSVLNIGSVNAYCGEPNLLPYSISKGGLMTLTRNVADALGPEQVRVNQMNIGWTLTPNENRLKIAEGLPADWAQRPPGDVCPSGRLLMPEDVAGMAVYWLSDESRPISGTVLDFAQHPIIGRNPPKRME